MLFAPDVDPHHKSFVCHLRYPVIQCTMHFGTSQYCSFSLFAHSGVSILLWGAFACNWLLLSGQFELYRKLFEILHYILFFSLSWRRRMHYNFLFDLDQTLLDFHASEYKALGIVLTRQTGSHSQMRSIRLSKHTINPSGWNLKKGTLQGQSFLRRGFWMFSDDAKEMPQGSIPWRSTMNSSGPCQ